MADTAADGDRAPTLPTALAAALGFAAFLPVGISYLLLLILSAYLLAPPARLRQRLAALPPGAWRTWLLAGLLAFVLWPLVVVALTATHEATASRLFHVVRVAWVLLLGLALLPRERQAALAGFLAGAGASAGVIAVHHLWPLPAWPLWDNLLTVTGNNSSQKMILMACAAGVALSLAIGPERGRRARMVLALAWLALGLAVILHGISRNAYLLVALLPPLALLHRLRSWRAGAAAVALGALVAVAAWNVSPAVPERVHSMLGELRALSQQGDFSGSSGVRWRMFQEAGRGMLEHPLTGTGVGSWSGIWERASTAFPALGAINNPHNDFLLFGMETGVPGLLLLLAVLAWFVAVNWRSRSAAGGAGFVLVSAVIITAMVNAPLRDAGLGMSLLWLMAAATSGAARQPRAAT